MDIIEEQLERLVAGNVIMSEVEKIAYLAASDNLGRLANETVIPVGYKRCGGCHMIKKFYLFNRNGAVKNCCTGNCKECQKSTSKKSYDKTKHLRDYKNYYEEHKEIKQANGRAYYEKHKEEITERQKAYRNSGAGKKAMNKAHKKRRRTLKKYVGIKYTRAMVIDRDKMGEELAMCYLCGLPIASDTDIQLDHVIPVALKGLDCFTNIAATHSKCNLQKSKDAREITAEQVYIIRTRAEEYIDLHPELFPELFEDTSSEDMEIKPS